MFGRRTRYIDPIVPFGIQAVSYSAVPPYGYMPTLQRGAQRTAPTGRVSLPLLRATHIWPFPARRGDGRPSEGRTPLVHLGGEGGVRRRAGAKGGAAPA